MKRIYYPVAIILFFFMSCDPDVPGEGITLPTMNFNIKINPDTAYIKLGDTLTISSSISNNLNNGIIITDGIAKINLFFGYCAETPVNASTFTGSVHNEHFKIVDIAKGGINISTTTNKIKEIYASTSNDSIQLEISLIPLKVGTYVFQVQSLFFEGSQGRTRTNPKFNMPNHHFDELRKDVSYDIIPGSDGYDSRYNFAVYE